MLVDGIIRLHIAAVGHPHAHTLHTGGCLNATLIDACPASAYATPGRTLTRLMQLHITAIACMIVWNCANASRLYDRDHRINLRRASIYNEVALYRDYNRSLAYEGSAQAVTGTCRLRSPSRCALRSRRHSIRMAHHGSSRHICRRMVSMDANAWRPAAIGHYVCRHDARVPGGGAESDGYVACYYQAQRPRS